MKNDYSSEPRIILLEKFFSTIFPGKIKIICFSPDNPNVIYNEEKALSCYISKDGELRFSNTPDKGKTVYSFPLVEKPEYDIDKIMSWFQTSEHRRMWKVVIPNTNPAMFLSGYNFIDRNKQEGKYPVFSLHSPKLYFQHSKAEEVAIALRKEGYSVGTC